MKNFLQFFALTAVLSLILISPASAKPRKIFFDYRPARDETVVKTDVLPLAKHTVVEGYFIHRGKTDKKELESPERRTPKAIALRVTVGRKPSSGDNLQLADASLLYLRWKNKDESEQKIQVERTSYNVLSKFNNLNVYLGRPTIAEVWEGTLYVSDILSLKDSTEIYWEVGDKSGKLDRDVPDTLYALIAVPDKK